MKERYIGKRIIVGAIVALIVAIFMINLLVTNTVPAFFSAPWMIVAYWLIIFILALASGLFFLMTCSVLIVGIFLNRHFNRREQEAEKTVKATLSHEFKTVRLKDMVVLDSILDCSTISCQAKLDENNEIVFQIQINANASGHTDDYSYFLEKFSID